LQSHPSASSFELYEHEAKSGEVEKIGLVGPPQAAAGAVTIGT